MIRLAYIQYAYDHDWGLTGDGFDYVIGSRASAAGHWYTIGGAPSSHHPPGWVTVLALAQKAFGFDSLVAVQRMTALIGVITVVLVGYLGRRIAGQRVGMLAAMIAAIYPAFWVFERDVLSEPLALVLLAGALLAFYALLDEPTPTRAGITGLLITLAGLTRAELFGFGVVLVVWLGFRSEMPRRQKAASVALTALAPLLLLVPWAVFNTARYEEPVIISTGMGPTMAAGACDTPFRDSGLLGYYSWDCFAAYMGPTYKALDASQLDKEFQRSAIRYYKEHLDRLPIVVLAREGRTFGFYEPFQEARLTASWTRAGLPAYQAWVIVYTLLVPFGIAGLVILRRRGRAVFPLITPFALAALATSFTFGQIRYRTIAEISVVIFASVALAEISRRLPFIGRSGQTEKASSPSRPSRKKCATTEV